MSSRNEDEWGVNALQILGGLTLLGGLIASIVLMSYTDGNCDNWRASCSFNESHPLFFEGLFLGLISLLQGVLLFGVSSYMAAQRRSARSLGRSLGKIETKLDKIERGLSRIPVSSGEQHSKSDRPEEHDSNEEIDKKSSGTTSLYFGGKSLLAEGIEYNKRKKSQGDENSP